MRFLKNKVTIITLIDIMLKSANVTHKRSRCSALTVTKKVHHHLTLLYSSKMPLQVAESTRGTSRRHILLSTVKLFYCFTLVILRSCIIHRDVALKMLFSPLKLCIGSFVGNSETKTKHFLMTGRRWSQETPTDCVTLLCNQHV